MRVPQQRPNAPVTLAPHNALRSVVTHRKMVRVVSEIPPYRALARDYRIGRRIRAIRQARLTQEAA
jgi:hypothetical protein